VSEEKHAYQLTFYNSSNLYMMLDRDRHEVRIAVTVEDAEQLIEKLHLWTKAKRAGLFDIKVQP
jgi:Lon protease-like protein